MEKGNIPTGRAQRVDEKNEIICDQLQKINRQYYGYYEWKDRYYEWTDEYCEWTDEYYQWTSFATTASDKRGSAITITAN